MKEDEIPLLVFLLFRLWVCQTLSRKRQIEKIIFRFQNKNCDGAGVYTVQYTAGQCRSKVVAHQATLSRLWVRYPNHPNIHNSCIQIYRKIKIVLKSILLICLL